MRILLIGAGGTVGRVVRAALSDYDVVAAGRTSGDVRVDLSNEASIRRMYDVVGSADAVICCAGEAKWDFMKNLTTEDYYFGLGNKLMGQVNLVRHGVAHLTQNGSFTLTTGILADRPVPMTTSAAMVNGGIHSFVKAAALELLYGIRINVVSAGLVEDSAEKYKDYFPGHTPVTMQAVSDAYLSSVEGAMTGEVIRVY